MTHPPLPGQSREIFAFAQEHRLPVLIHAGRGIPALGQHTLELSEEFDDVEPFDIDTELYGPLEAES